MQVPGRCSRNLREPGETTFQVTLLPLTEDQAKNVMSGSPPGAGSWRGLFSDVVAWPARL